MRLSLLAGAAALVISALASAAEPTFDSLVADIQAATKGNLEQRCAAAETWLKNLPQSDIPQARAQAAIAQKYKLIELQAECRARKIVLGIQ